jgi:lipopolysaccharide/colanic/teichoic acid biosynthesis glycosyltransferase
VKLLFDLTFAFSGLLILSPLFAAIAVWIRLDSPGPALFRQVRVGQNGREFRICKFRTMHVDAEQVGPQVSRGDDPRITRSGRFLRTYKLDELPQLINVLRGEMSLVGPRPEVPKYVAAYPEAYREILTVKPGMTDYAALEYLDENELLRGVADPEKKYLEEILPVKIELSRTYLKNRSGFTDIVLIFRTLWKIVT